MGTRSSFNFDNVWGKKTLRLLLHGLYEGTSLQPKIIDAIHSPLYPQLVAGLDVIGAAQSADREKMEVRRFLNRLLGLPLTQQNALFDLFCTTLEAVISAARKDGKYDEGIADLAGASVSLEEPEALLWSDPLTGAKMHSALVRVDRGSSWESACTKLAERLRQDAKPQREVGASEAARGSAAEGLATDGAHGPCGSSDSEDEDGEEDEEVGDEMDDFIVDDDIEEGGEEEWMEEGYEQEGREEQGGHTEQLGASVHADSVDGDGDGDDGEQMVELDDETEDEEDAAAVAAGEGSPAGQRRPRNLDWQKKPRPKPTTTSGPAVGRAAANTGFFRSRFLQAGERLYVLAVPRANREGLYLLTRPNTGDSPFEEEEEDLRRKYEKISAEEARAGWSAAYNGALHENAGGRLSHLQMLTGSTLPLLPLLEAVVKKHAAILTKRDQAVAAVRVQMDDRRLVGVRFPRSLMLELRSELLAFQAQRGKGTSRLTVDAVQPFDPAAFAVAMRPPQTLKSFFAKKSAAQPPAAAAPASAVTSGYFANSSRSAGVASAPSAPSGTSSGVPTMGRASNGGSIPSRSANTSTPSAARASIDLTADDSPTKADAELARRLQAELDEEGGTFPAAHAHTAAASKLAGVGSAGTWARSGEGASGGLLGRQAAGGRSTTATSRGRGGTGRGASGGASGMLANFLSRGSSPREAAGQAAAGKAPAADNCTAGSSGGSTSGGAKKRKSVLELMRDKQQPRMA